MMLLFMVLPAFLLAIRAQAGYSYHETDSIYVTDTSLAASSSDVTSEATSEATGSYSVGSVYNSSGTATTTVPYMVTTQYPTADTIPPQGSAPWTSHHPSHSWSFNGTLPTPLPTGGTVVPCHSHSYHKSNTTSYTTTSTFSSSTDAETRHIATLASYGHHIPGMTGAGIGHQLVESGGFLPEPRPHQTTTKKPLEAPRNTGTSEPPMTITFSGFTISLPWETTTLQPTTWTTFKKLAATKDTEPSDTVVTFSAATWTFSDTTLTAHPETLTLTYPTEAPVTATVRPVNEQEKIKRSEVKPTTFIRVTTTTTFQNYTLHHHTTRPLMPKPVVTRKPQAAGSDDEKTKQPLQPKLVLPIHEPNAKRADANTLVRLTSSTTSSSATTWPTSSPFSLQCDSSACNTYCHCDQDGNVVCSYDPAACTYTCKCAAK